MFRRRSAASAAIYEVATSRFECDRVIHRETPDRIIFADPQSQENFRRSFDNQIHADILQPPRWETWSSSPSLPKRIPRVERSKDRTAAGGWSAEGRRAVLRICVRFEGDNDDSFVWFGDGVWCCVRDDHGYGRSSQLLPSAAMLQASSRPLLPHAASELLCSGRDLLCRDHCLCDHCLLDRLQCHDPSLRCCSGSGIGSDAASRKRPDASEVICYGCRTSSCPGRMMWVLVLEKRACCAWHGEPASFLCVTESANHCRATGSLPHASDRLPMG